jgi:peptide deformylase
MIVLEDIESPEKVLLTKAEEVKKFDEKFKVFVQDMLDTMKESKGIGLAANQVNSLQRVLVIKIDHDNNKYDDQEPEEKMEWHGKTFVVVNPVITKRSGKTKYMEGCLSFPEMYDFCKSR